jgi:hypothetical protein
MISCSTSTELSCAEGLSFDYATQKCIDKPDCTPTTTTTLATITVATTPPTVATTQSVTYLVCSPTGKIFHPHPTDCEKLIKCELIENTNQYTSIIQTCPG